MSKLKKQIEYQKLEVKVLKLKLAGYVTYFLNGFKLKEKDIKEMEEIVKVIIEKGGAFSERAVNEIKMCVKSVKEEKNGSNDEKQS